MWFSISSLFSVVKKMTDNDHICQPENLASRTKIKNSSAYFNRRPKDASRWRWQVSFGVGLWSHVRWQHPRSGVVRSQCCKRWHVRWMLSMHQRMGRRRLRSPGCSHRWLIGYAPELRSGTQPQTPHRVSEWSLSQAPDEQKWILVVFLFKAREKDFSLLNMSQLKQLCKI